MNVLSAHQPSIPLHCNICPKKPDFSDVSHLLTHVASKSHLSNYYKMKVRGSADPAAKRLVDDYDEWYEDHNLQDLMRERMSQKERKRGARNAGNASRRVSGAPSMSARSTPAPALNGRGAARQPRGSMLDPQLGSRIKTEPQSRSATPGLGLTLDTANFNRLYAPPMQSWPTTPYDVESPLKLESFGSSFSDEDASFELDVPFYQPRPRRRNGRKFNDSDDSLLNADEWEMDETINDAAKLKGVYWPGIGMFDSATPEMKRKRNQKKAFSVTQQLLATSLTVEAQELVFDSNGILRKLRDISGNYEDEDDVSHISGETTPEPEPQPKRSKQSRRPRQPLAPRNVNSGRVLRGRRDSHHPPFGNSTRSAPYFDGNDEDDDLTYGQRLPKPKKRTGLSIHRDNSGPEITFDQPPPINILASSFTHPFQAHNTPQPRFAHPQQSSKYIGAHQRVPSLTFDGGFGGSFRPANHLATNNGNGMRGLSGLGSFGQLGQTFPFANENSVSHMGGAMALAAFQQQYGGVGTMGLGGLDSGCGLGNEHLVFQPANQNPINGQPDWDAMFGFGNPDALLSGPPGGGAAPGLQAGGVAGVDTTGVNPLFFSSNQAGPDEDGEVTVSAVSDSER